MFVPDNKKIEVVGLNRYIRAVGFWIDGVWHLSAYHANEVKLHLPFCNKELCNMKQWYHLTICCHALYAISLLILDEDTVDEYNLLRKEMVEIWNQIEA